MTVPAMPVPRRDLGISAFGPDTVIETEEGPLPLEWVVAGQRVMTRDGGSMAVLWTAASAPEELGEAGMPVEIPAGALGFGVPSVAVIVAASHRILIRHPAADLYFAAPEVFVAARDLMGINGITTADHGPNFAFVHVALSHSAVIETDGLTSATLGLSGEMPPHPVLDPAEVRVLRSALAVPATEPLRKSA